MKGFFRNIAVAALSVTLALGGAVSAFGAIPQAYWKYQEPFQTARDAGNNSEILSIGSQILALYEALPMDNDKAGILYTTAEAMYPAYEKQGNYQEAIKCLKILSECGTILGYADGVKIAEARIKKIDPMTEVYALSQNNSSIPYYSAKHEPRAGAYYGRVFTENGKAPMDSETAVSFYIEFLQDNIADYDRFIRPQADGKKIIHIALNMPNENDSLKTVAGADSYINEFFTYIKGLNVPVLVRIGGEMNVWQNLADPALFKQAYIKIASAGKAIAPNAAMLFSPNDISNWNTNIETYYPGDEYVDWVGVSLYTDKFRNSQNPVTVEDFEEMFYGNGAYANPISKLRNVVELYGGKKPIMITEGATGHAIYGNSSLDLTAFAKNRVNMLYTYVNMVYPQVKGIVYFDHDLQTGKYNYSLSTKPEMMEQYMQSTSSNSAMLKSISQTPQTYVKLKNYSDNLPELKLATYCVLPGNIIAYVSYELDGALLTQQKAMPFNCTIPTASIAAGAHNLSVSIKGENGYNIVKDYTLTKDASGLVTVSEK